MAARDRSNRDRRPKPQLDVFDGAQHPVWPTHRHYPYNYDGLRVETVVNEDMRQASDALIITGYTSLPRIISFFAHLHHRLQERPDTIARVRVLIGHDPVARTSRTYPIIGGLSQAITDYWLNVGVSILQSGEIIRALEILNRADVEVRSSGETPVHAKIYATENAITGGSSNYSDAGLTWQLEANWRFERSDARYQESMQLANAIWATGVDYKETLGELLNGLLRASTWQEALLRAAAELLEGEWAKLYVSAEPYGPASRLWPSQEAGVAQAMWVLSNVGSVLIADAAGSGKTKLGSYVIRAVQQRNWRLGRMRQDVPVIICPPAVKHAWITECMSIGIRPDVHSHGVLSVSASKRRGATRDAIRQAQVIAIDEAHNFHNRSSRRTRGLYANMADHVVLFTATPINRGPVDLLAIVDLLGADNFDESTLKTIEGAWRRLKRGGRRQLKPDELAGIKNAIRQFTIRRTKSDLNRLVDWEPDRYRDTQGRACRYPEHDARLYGCGSTQRDRERAQEIRHLARRLIGVGHFQQPLQLPKHLAAEGYDEASYRDQRLRSAQALAIHHVAATLRSSRAALLEHLLGTAVACAKCGFDPGAKNQSGNRIDHHRALAGNPPGSRLTVPVPDWLIDRDAHQEACEHDARLFEQMAQLADELTDGREETKANLLIKLLSSHTKIIAFDSRPITLMDMRHRLRDKISKGVILAVGGQHRARSRVMDAFADDSDTGLRLALCSDALAEGINLQGASAIVLLDMPSVIRIAEQRIGRIDRMDSPHKTISVYWPDDSAEYALRTDELFFDRHRHVKELLGSNLTLPKLFRRAAETESEEITADEYVASLDELAEARILDGIADAFSPVRNLVEGNEPMTNPTEYRHFRKSKARVLSCVSVVHSAREWSFYAVAGSEREAPRWVFLDCERETAELDLAIIERRLREVISPGSDSYCIDQELDSRLRSDAKLLQAHERTLLPGKKQRALHEMSHMMKIYDAASSKVGDVERLKAVHYIQKLLESGGTVDLNRLAEWWLDVIRPQWYEHLSTRTRKRPALLKDLRMTLKDNPIPTHVLASVQHVPLEGVPIDNRIVSAIIGVRDVSQLQVVAH